MYADEDNDSRVFSRENIDKYLFELAKEYRKLAGKKTPAEIILVGGAAVITLYRFREDTVDIDAIIQAASAIKEAIAHVEEKYHLPFGWINSDFQKTTSYSPNLVRCSAYYRTFCQVLNVRIVKAEYLIAMKLRAFRQYKHDVSDIIGILVAHDENGDIITIERIDQAMKELYGSWEGVSPEAVEYIKNRIEQHDYMDMFEETQQNEREMKEDLMRIEKNYPDLLPNNSIAQIIEGLRKKKAEKEQKAKPDQTDRRDSE